MNVTAEAARRFLVVRHMVAPARSLQGGTHAVLGVACGRAREHPTMIARRRSPFAEVTATVTVTLLVCDAWFDVLTSRGASAVVQASVEAALVELPLAALCFWIARNLAHAVEVARPYLQAIGFTIRDNKLVPPAEPSPGVT